VSAGTYARRYFIGAGVVYVLLLIAVAATPDGGEFAQRAGAVLVRALFGALLALGVDRATNKRMPLAAFVALCVVGALIVSALAGGANSS
jgi:hypothetical protein